MRNSTEMPGEDRPKDTEEARAQHNELMEGCEAVEATLTAHKTYLDAAGISENEPTELLQTRENIQEQIRKAGSDEQKATYKEQLVKNTTELKKHYKEKAQQHMPDDDLKKYNDIMKIKEDERTDDQQEKLLELQKKKDLRDAVMGTLAKHDDLTAAKQKVQDHNDKGYRTEYQHFGATEQAKQANHLWLTSFYDKVPGFKRTTKQKNLSKIAQLEEMHKALEGSDLHKNALTKTSDEIDKQSIVYQHITNLQVLYEQIQEEHTNAKLSANEKEGTLKKYDSELAAMKKAYIGMLVKGDSLSQNEEILMMCYLGGGTDEKQQRTALEDLTTDLQKALKDAGKSDENKKLIKAVKGKHGGCFVDGELHMIGGQPANVTGDDLKQIANEINAKYPRTRLERALCRPAAAKIVKDKNGIVTIEVRNKYRDDLITKMETAHHRNNKNKVIEPTKQEVEETKLGSEALGEAGIESSPSAVGVADSGYEGDDDTDESEEEDDYSESESEEEDDDSDHTESWQTAAGGGKAQRSAGGGGGGEEEKSGGPSTPGNN